MTVINAQDKKKPRRAGLQLLSTWNLDWLPTTLSNFCSHGLTITDLYNTYSVPIYLFLYYSICYITLPGIKIRFVRYSDSGCAEIQQRCVITTQYLHYLCGIYRTVWALYSPKHTIWDSRCYIEVDSVLNPCEVVPLRHTRWRMRNYLNGVAQRW